MFFSILGDNYIFFDFFIRLIIFKIFKMYVLNNIVERLSKFYDIFLSWGFLYEVLF